MVVIWNGTSLFMSRTALCWRPISIWVFIFSTFANEYFFWVWKRPMRVHTIKFIKQIVLYFSTLYFDSFLFFMDERHLFVLKIDRKKRYSKRCFYRYSKRFIHKCFKCEVKWIKFHTMCVLRSYQLLAIKRSTWVYTTITLIANRENKISRTCSIAIHFFFIRRR